MTPRAHTAERLQRGTNSIETPYRSLENNGLTKIEPEILSELPSLEILDLSRNILVELDKNVFKNLSALKKLNLCGNNINK